MTPPTLDGAMLQAKLRAMRELLDDLDGAGDLDADSLQADRMLRHGVERILTQLVELAAGVNGHLAVTQLGRGAATYRESFELAERVGALPADLAARLVPSVGLRSVLVHEYAAVDLRLVASGAERAKSDYRAYIRAVAQFLPD